jgi:hypothetical protein
MSLIELVPFKYSEKGVSKALLYAIASKYVLFSCFTPSVAAAATSLAKQVLEDFYTYHWCSEAFCCQT